MMGNNLEKTPQALETEQLVILPIQKYIEGLLNSQGEMIDCITWEGLADDQLLNNGYAGKLPLGTEVYHCFYESSHDPHHWLEVDLPGFKKQTYIWDGTKQKLPGVMFINKSTPGLWNGFFAGDVRRQQIYPEAIE